MRALILVTTLTIAIGSQSYASNPIQVENARSGTTDWQLFHESRSGEIEGYASATSVNRGDTIRFYVRTTDTQYRLSVYRMGWYDGAGGRLLHGPVTRNAQSQPMPCPTLPSGAVECKWNQSYSLTIPDSSDPSVWASGVYIVKLTALNLLVDKYIPFVVRDHGRRSTHYFQTSVTTYQAYNNWGGRSLYSWNSCTDWRSDCEDPLPVAHAVSFDRPYNDGAGTGDFLWRWDYNMIRFLEREGYDVTYSTNVDTHRRGALLLEHNDFLSVGHDEYWSWQMRANVEAALAAGVNLGFFSANTCYWQVRFEESSRGVADRIVVSHKEDAAESDPYALDADTANDKYVTTRWRDAPVSRPEAALLGVQYVYSTVPDPAYPNDPDDIVIDEVSAAPWVFEDSGLTDGSVLPSLLGYEVDATSSASPSNIIRLARSPYVDRKSGGVTRYSEMTVYTASSGATVFATGTIQWAWGLDSWNSGATRVNGGAQQMTRNILRRLAGSGAAADCRFTLVPLTATVTSAAGSGSVTLTAGTGCTWTASSSAGWLTVMQTSGSDDAVIQYQYTQNSGVARSGTIAIGDRNFKVTQHGSTISLEATAIDATRVALSWTSVSNSATYEILRGATPADLAVITTRTTTAHTDTGRTPGVSYVYRVRVGNIVSNIDVATMIAFTDDPLVPRSTIVKAAHLAELRQGANALRAAAGLGPATFTDSGSAGTPIRRQHVSELRTAVNGARSALGLSAMSYTSLPLGGLIRAEHFEELRRAIE